jgi:hypothetical protein
MSLNTVEEIEQAIGNLGPQEIEALRLWLDGYGRPQPIDLQIEADFAAGRLDKFMREALDDDNNGRTQPL